MALTEQKQQKRDQILAECQKRTLLREMTLKRESVDVEARTVEVAFSSEEPVERWFGTEILDHSPNSVDLGRLSNSGPGLVDHDPRDHVATVEKCSIDSDRVGRATLRFGRSQRAEEIFQDVVDGIRKCISVGYRILKLEIDDPDSDDSVYRATRWEPFEISFVSIPADTAVGVGRSEPEPLAPAPAPAPLPQITVTRNARMADPINEQEVTDRARAAEAARVKEIVSFGRQYAEFGGNEIAQTALSSDKDIRWVQDEVMRSLAEKAKATPTAPDIGLSGAETKRYSVLRAVNALVAVASGQGNPWKDAGLEREAHEACVKRFGEAAHGGLLIPYEVQKRDMTVASASGGGYLVGTDHKADSFIELLRKRALLARLGAIMLPGLKGDVTIPKQTAAGTAYWLSTESTDITESAATLGQLALTPKNVGAYTEISRQLMLQSSPAADMLVMDDLSKVMALAIDLAGISGSGSSGQPTGIVNTSGIGSVSGSSLAYAGILEFQTDVASAEALAENCAYVTTPAVASLLAQRQKFSSTDTPLWEGNLLDAKMCGFTAASTNQMASATMMFGDFSSVVIGEWGVLELALNPYANFAAGIIGIRAFQTCDVGVRRAGAFSYASSIS